MLSKQEINPMTGHCNGRGGFRQVCRDGYAEQVVLEWRLQDKSGESCLETAMSVFQTVAIRKNWAY